MNVAVIVVNSTRVGGEFWQLQFNNLDPQIKSYGCLAHPDYGLYIPRFR